MAKKPIAFVFRINELRESDNFASARDINGQWVPTDAPGANVVISAGATNVFWLCNGTSIGVLANDSKLLGRVTPYKTFSVFYSDGKGFHLLRDNALTTKREEGFFPLTFEHDPANFSSYLTNAKYEPALYCYRKDQKWMKMLLPDHYHGRCEVAVPYGGLKGELAIFLALVAFAIPVDGLQQYLPSMFHSGEWQQYNMANGRTDKRGVIVEVWTFPSRYGGSSKQDLEAYEENGMYYA